LFTPALDSSKGGDMVLLFTSKRTGVEEEEDIQMELV
jgi:hypothetical protein